MSLRARILALTVGIVATVLVLFSLPLVLLMREVAIEDGRQSATDVAQGVADHLSAGEVDSREVREYLDRVNDRDDAVPVRVVLADGTSLGATIPALDAGNLDGDGHDRFDDHDGDNRYGSLRPTSAAQVRAVDGGEVVLIEVASGSGPISVAAFASTAEVQARVRERVAVLGAVVLVLLALAAIAGELVTRRLVRHLGVAAQTADRLGEGELGARVPDEGPPEVRRVGAALNRLAGRIDDLLAAERETVADLSHRLRTPLTAVRLDVEALAPSPQKAELEEHLDQLERTLTAVIHAARRSQREGAVARCDAAAVTRERFEFWAPLAEDQHRVITLDVDAAGLVVKASAADLGAAVDALLENAVAHTDEGVAIAVRAVPASAHTVFVEVRDRGPGIPASAVARGRSDRGSTGLGLDIARACAEASGGRLTLADDDGWSVVRLELGGA